MKYPVTRPTSAAAYDPARHGGYASKQHGFTLIELLVVIAIIGILAAIIIASLDSARSKARDAQRISQIREVQKALEMYYADNGSYPAGPLNSGCAAGVWNTPLAPLVSGKYIDAIPRDPLYVTTSTSSYCHNYASSTDASSWSCGGITRNNFTYAIIFSLENPNPNVMTATTDGFFNYCVTGERR